MKLLPDKQFSIVLGTIPHQSQSPAPKKVEMSPFME